MNPSVGYSINEVRAFTVQSLPRALTSEYSALGTKSSTHELLGDISDPNHKIMVAFRDEWTVAFAPV
jgi:hypothetical protein